MWKTITLCASLFGAAAFGLATLARWIDPAALPAMAGIVLCLFGVVLILAAPPRDEVASATAPLRPALAPSSRELPRVDDAATRATDKLQTI
jgi:hypothetical protein